MGKSAITRLTRHHLTIRRPIQHDGFGPGDAAVRLEQETRPKIIRKNGPQFALVGIDRPFHSMTFGAPRPIGILVAQIVVEGDDAERFEILDEVV